MKKITRSVSNGYISPKLMVYSFACEQGFAITNDNLKEENWGWDE